MVSIKISKIFSLGSTPSIRAKNRSNIENCIELGVQHLSSKQKSRCRNRQFILLNFLGFLYPRGLLGVADSLSRYSIRRVRISSGVQKWEYSSNVERFSVKERVGGSSPPTPATCSLPFS